MTKLTYYFKCFFVFMLFVYSTNCKETLPTSQESVHFRLSMYFFKRYPCKIHSLFDHPKNAKKPCHTPLWELTRLVIS